MAKYWFLLLFLIGCGNRQLPNQDKAVDLVWHQVFQETASPPEINWIETLNCHDMEGYYQGSVPAIVVTSGSCVGGAFWPTSYWIDLAHISDVFSETAFTHELLHAHLLHLYGDGDGGHARPEWGGSQSREANVWDYGQETLVINAL